MQSNTAEVTTGKPGIFISYSHQDSAFCKRLIDDLRRDYGSETVWYDDGLTGGDEWWRRIRTELRTRPVFLVVLTPNAAKSRWVDDEISLAWAQRNSGDGKIIIPVIYQAGKYRDDILTLRTQVSFVAPRTYDTAYADLRRTLDRAVAEREKRRATKSVEPGNAEGQRRTLPLIALTAMLVLIFSFGALLATKRITIGANGSSKQVMTVAATHTTEPIATPSPQPAQLTQTALASITINDPKPGPCSDTPKNWNQIQGIQQVVDENDLVNKNLLAGYSCPGNATHLMLRSTVAGNYQNIDMRLSKSLSSLNKYTVQVTCANRKGSGSINLTFDNVYFYVNDGGNYSISLVSSAPASTPTPTPTPFNLNGNIGASWTGLTYAMTFDGQQVTISINGKQLHQFAYTNILYAHSFAINFQTGSGTVASIDFSNFQITPQ